MIFFKYISLTIVLLLSLNNVFGQSGDGHSPSTTLSYTASGYSTATKMLQDAGSTTLAKNTINNNAASHAFVNFTFNTSGKNVYIIYTTDGSTPNKSNGNQVSASFSNYSAPNSTFTSTIPSQSAGTTVKYLFYISDSNVASAWGKVDANGYGNSWNEGTLNAFSYVVKTANTQTGTWATGSTWASGSEPSDSSDVEIIASTTVTVSSTSATTNDLSTISNGAITIAKNGALKITGDFSNSSGNINLNSDSDEFSSLIVQGSSSGNIIYNRYVNSLSNGSGWDLVGSPVNGLQISSFVSTNDSGGSPLATGNGSGAGASGEYAIGTYDSSNNSWSNYTSANVSTTQFTPGKGYQMATDSGATLTFTGTVDTNATETIAIEDYSDGSGSHWNLISNPYPSFITIGPNSTTDTFLEVNDDVIHATYVGVYGYDADNSNGSNYTVYNNSSNGKIAPGQGFFVAARSTSTANITFKEEMQTASTGDDFISGDNMENTEVELRIYNDNSSIGNTKLFFEENLTPGLDIGWDAGSFSQSDAIMTRLIEDDEGHGLAINAMGLDAMENAVIPLVINQSAGQEFRVNLHTATIPDPNVYLEDVEEGTFTNLYEGDFVLTPTSDLEGVGRFFIHMSADTMSNEDVSTSLLNAYKEVDASFITIEGLATQTNETKVSLYNILGREVFSTTLNNNMNTQTISTVGLSSGIYVIELESGTDRLTKKLLIQ